MAQSIPVFAVLAPAFILPLKYRVRCRLCARIKQGARQTDINAHGWEIESSHVVNLMYSAIKGTRPNRKNVRSRRVSETQAPSAAQYRQLLWPMFWRAYLMVQLRADTAATAHLKIYITEGVLLECYI